MKFIATDVSDTKEKMRDMVSTQLGKPGFAMDRYFYRSHVTYEAELHNIIFKSWLYAGHVSQVRESGDFFLFEIGEDSLIISKDDRGDISAMHNICRHRGARVCEDKSGNRKKGRRATESAVISLHVRAANRPAISLYQSLGLKVGELEFPEWFDWHGGHTLEASCEEIIAKVQAKYRGR